MERFMYACGTAGIGLMGGLVLILILGNTAWGEDLTLKAGLGADDDTLMVFTVGGAVLGFIVGLIRWDG